MAQRKPQYSLVSSICSMKKLVSPPSFSWVIADNSFNRAFTVWKSGIKSSFSFTNQEVCFDTIVQVGKLCCRKSFLTWLIVSVSGVLGILIPSQNDLPSPTGRNSSSFFSSNCFHIELSISYTVGSSSLYWLSTSAMPEVCTALVSFSKRLLPFGVLLPRVFFFIFFWNDGRLETLDYEFSPLAS